jgi:hypothetical protein
LLGSLVLLLPGVSVDVVAIGVGVALLVSGLYDLWCALTGRRRGTRRPSRWLALLRAPFSILFVGIIVLVPNLALGVLVGLLGIYIGIRGLLMLVSAASLARRDLGMSATAPSGTPWGDPVGWAGLAKVSPNPAAERTLIRQRVEELDAEIDRLASTVATDRTELRIAAAGLTAPEAQTERGTREEEVSATRLAQVHLEDERRALKRALATEPAAPGPHDHLRHRRTPIAAKERTRSRLLGAWSVLSTPLLLLVLAWLFYPDTPASLALGVLAIAVVLSVEAFARGYFFSFVVRLLLVLLVVNLIELYLQNWQWGTTILFATLALVVLVVNLRDAIRR